MKHNRAINYKAFYIAGCLFLALSIPMWATLNVWLHHEKSIIRSMGIGEVRNLSIAFEEHVSSVIESADGLIKDLRKDAITNKSEFQRTVKEEIGVNGKKNSQLSLIDSEGRLTYSSLGSLKNKIDLKDREHFNIHKQHPTEDKLYVSKPVLGKLSGIWSIQLTRPVLNNGTFEGVMVLSIPVAYFSDFFYKIDIGREGLISLIGFDGVPRVASGRQPDDIGKYDKTALAKAAEISFFGKSSGYYNGAGLVSGRPAITAYRRLDDAQLNVLVEISESELLAPYYQTRNHFLILAIVSTLLIMLVTYFVYKSIEATIKKNEYLNKSYRELTNRISTDSLTQVRSRGRFYEELQPAFNKAKSGQSKICVLLIDIDHFKNVNDSYGHLVGDVVLKQVASICKRALRKHDVIGRLGGDEFAVILGDVDMAQGLLVAEKLRSSVEQARIQTTRGVVKITISTGIACVDHSMSRADGLIGRADDALYEAKRTGRNRISAPPYETT